MGVGHAVAVRSASLVLSRALQSFRNRCAVVALRHIASYGMSGPSMLNKQRIMHVNVGGTHVVVELCRQLGVRALVYTSTYNVVFGGKPLCGGTEENTPYFPPDEQVDEYSRTKTLAEQLVLAPHPTVRGESTGPHLRRCAIRPAAIFGEDEDRHFPRIVSLVRRGTALTSVVRLSV
eukprot:m.428776 g.428776  ORF g.428776 m.428776 type:complete len:177 (-) comp21382_c0_seq9:649-1179(-)